MRTEEIKDMILETLGDDTKSILRFKKVNVPCPVPLLILRLIFAENKLI